MLMTGSNMGIIQATRTMKNCPNESERATDLMSRLLRFEENNYQVLKQFLKRTDPFL